MGPRISRRRSRLPWVAALALIFCLSFSAVAYADVIFDVNTVFSGTSPTGTPPWLTATFANSGIDEVTLTLEANDIGTQFVSEWFFNIDHAMIATFDISQDSGPTAGLMAWGINAFQADGDGLFDIEFNFATAANQNRFDNSDTAIFTITADGLTENSFLFASAPGGGEGVWLSAAHIQGIGIDGEDSGWVGAPVPIPGAVWLLGVGLIGVLGLRRKS